MKLTAEDILYEDKHIIVCRKKSGIATQTAKLGEPDMESALKNYVKAGYIGVVHRLDQPVEGILVFAKTREAAANLSTQSRKQLMNKKYYAVAAVQTASILKAKEQLKEKQEHTLIDYLIKNGKKNVSEVVTDQTGGAKRAELIYRIEKGLPYDYGEGKEALLALIKIKLLTGRHHQIRVQLANAGMPLLGDGKYGSEESKDISKKQGLRNVALCAYSLEFRHPVTGEKMCFSIEPEGEAFQPFLPVNA